MKISLNWLKKYVKVTVPDDELVRLIGARLVEVEGVIDEMHKYDNIYIVRVVSAEKIPDTHLTLCKIDVGEKRDLAKVLHDEDGSVQVMCGAPNVREGMLAVWIAPGAIVPASVHEDAPFVIGKRKMLGKYDSYGMLAGADELDFDDKHEKIAEIDPEVAKPGDLLADVFELNDLILEIENKSLTHRPDTFGLIGFAREVAGILGEAFETPYLGHTQGRSAESMVFNNALSNAIKINDPGICQRYTAMVLEKHGELKKKYLTWQDTILCKSGMRPVDSIVDATNYLMLLTGQPLHAFDYDKFVAVGGKGVAEIVVRLARSGEKLVLLDGKEIELNENDIVICSGDVPVALAGAMGGASTEISEETRNIILESATFSLYNLRKTQMAHGIFSEAITRFTKGQPPYQTLEVAEECARMLTDGFRVVDMADKYDAPQADVVVKVGVDEINALLGTDYNEKLIAKTLENVGFVVKAKHGMFDIVAPAWRTDIHIKEDIIEEVGRLLGYDNITPTLPKHATADNNKMLTLKSDIRELMRSFGANEVLTYSFISERILRRAGLSADNSYKIINSISPDLQYVRQSIVPSLLEKAQMNQKLPVNQFAIYEMNKVYRKEWGMDEENVPQEQMRMGLVLAERKTLGTPYYKAKKYVEELLKELGISASFLPVKGDDAEKLPFEPKRAAEIWASETYLGVVGEFKASVRRNFKLAEFLAGFELNLDTTLVLRKKKTVSENFEIKDKQDLTITTTKTYAEVFKDACVKYPDAIITPVSIYQPDNSDEKNITLHLEFH